MKYGISIPNFGAYADVREVARLAKRAEDAGFHGFFTWDHIHNTGWEPGSPEPVPASDPIVALTAIAMVTERIRFGPLITPLPRRRPWKVAREMVTLDHLSQGRLILGVGLGFPPEDEYEAFGEQSDWPSLASSLDESLDILQGLWSGERFSFDGERYQLRDVQMLPRPVQQPRIPIWCAGMWPGRRPFRRAAHWDGVFPIHSTNGLMTVQEVKDVAARIRAERGDLDKFDIVAPIDLDILRGSPEEREYEEVGATWRTFSPYSREEMEALLG